MFFLRVDFFHKAIFVITFLKRQITLNGLLLLDCSLHFYAQAEQISCNRLHFQVLFRSQSRMAEFFHNICAHRFRECCTKWCENKILSGAIRTTYLGPDSTFIEDWDFSTSLCRLRIFPSYKKMKSLFPAWEVRPNKCKKWDTFSFYTKY